MLFGQRRVIVVKQARLPLKAPQAVPTVLLVRMPGMKQESAIPAVQDTGPMLEQLSARSVKLADSPQKAPVIA